MQRPSLDVAVQPPLRARLGVPLYPPLALKICIPSMSNGDNIMTEDLTQMWAYAVLLNEAGEVIPEALTGDLVDSAHALTVGQNSGTINGFFIFNNINIQSEGSFRIRITLMHMESESEAASIISVQTRPIQAVNQEVPTEMPRENKFSSIRSPMTDDRHRVIDCSGEIAEMAT
jgi:hypothetical protein